MSLLDHPGWSAAVGGVVGLVVVAVMVGLEPPAPSPPPGPTAQAATDFLSAWRAHLLASWSVTQIDTRVTTAGATLRTPVHEAQRPPDRVREGGVAVEARRGSTLVACAVPPGGDHPVCRQAPATQTWAQATDAEMALLTRLVTGTRPVYAVTARPGGCFDLTLLRPPDSVPVSLGRGSQYCLDPTTGAVLSSRVQRVGAVDTVTTTEVHAPARDSDLSLPPDATFGA